MRQGPTIAGRNQGSRSRGFNLVEILLAMFIFVIAILGIVGIYPASIRSVQQAKTRMLALELAEYQMDYALSLPFDQQVNRPIVNDPQPSPYTLKANVHGIQQVMTFNYSVLVNQLAVDLYDIRVQVNWQEGSGPLGSKGTTSHVILLESQLHK